MAAYGEALDNLTCWVPFSVSKARNRISSGLVFRNRYDRVLPPCGARLRLSYNRLLLLTSTRVVQEMLGHANIRQTMDTYSHVLPNIQQQAAERMDEMLG